MRLEDYPALLSIVLEVWLKVFDLDMCRGPESIRDLSLCSWWYRILQDGTVERHVGRHEQMSLPDYGPDGTAAQYV